MFKVRLCCKFLFKYASAAFLGAFLFNWFNVNFTFLSSHIKSGQSVVDLSYTDLASINLTAVTVLLAALGLLIAVAAIFGYYVIKDAITRVTEEKVNSELKAKVKAELKTMEYDGRLGMILQKVLPQATQLNPDDGIDNDE